RILPHKSLFLSQIQNFAETFFSLNSLWLSSLLLHISPPSSPFLCSTKECSISNSTTKEERRSRKKEAEKRRRIYLTSQEDSYKYDQINKEVIKETLAYEDVFIILLCTLFRIDYN
ncbi:hypothetical protein LINPERHAP1_LOCUS26607, partial [Linum perenne]